MKNVQYYCSGEYWCLRGEAVGLESGAIVVNGGDAMGGASVGGGLLAASGQVLGFEKAR